MGLIVESRFPPAGGGLAIVTLAGELDVASAAELRGHLAALIGDGAGHLILDFARVEFADSNGLGVLAGVHRLLRTPPRPGADEGAAGTGALAVASVNQRVRRLLRTSGFTRIIPIYPSVETAIVVHQAGPHHRPAPQDRPDEQDG